MFLNILDKYPQLHQRLVYVPRNEQVYTHGSVKNVNTYDT